ncbi:hypothetical protein FHX42_000903 [Saccharopolyspora lacisalsi]|uniref:RNA polymerase-binding protein RbpA n=1 Tax=Halosaccharopolyspora lacisalsi TaxID=1000566 RepID=A0A839DPZ7_9PSEU|nr:RNA polymerase-binding protein RbpA [Halosaccharopolyspora lacisalsi]MBA8823574.1 hypothetical protein [Halosaccharopolyspora lacisalsi]
MTGGNAIRGKRIGAGPTGEGERGHSAPRKQVDYWCGNGHHVRPSFAHDAEVPQQWSCPRCGLPAGQDAEHPPEPRRTEPHKTHLEYVKERRSDSDGVALLDEALTRLRGNRGR